MLECWAMEQEYTITQVAERFGVVRQYIHQLIRKHGIIPRRVDNALLGGTNYYYLLSDAQVASLASLIGRSARNGSRVSNEK